MLSARGCVFHYVGVFFLSVDCVVNFSQASYNGTEGDALNISIVSSSPSRDPLSVIVLGTGSPYRSITIPVEKTSVTFNFFTDEDNICEDDETFTLTLDAYFLPNKCIVGNPGSATVIVEDNDGE